METRVCKKCKEEKPLSEYPKNGIGAKRQQLFQWRCTKCTSAAIQKWREDNYEERLEYRAKYRFENLDKIHRETMIDLDHKIRKQKDVLFNSFAVESINVDSLITINGNLQAKKEAEVFRFFKSVRKICTPNQQEEFDKIINKALKGGERGGNRPSRNGENHHPREGIPPPR